MSGNPEREGGGATLQLGNPNSRFHVSKCADSPWDTPLQNPVSDFPSFRGPSVGLQRDPKIQIPCFQVCRFQDIPLHIPDKTRFRVSEFPRFQGPSVGPRRDPNFQIPCFLVGRFQDIRLRKFQIPRFRVCRFLDTPGQIPDSEFPSFRGPLSGSEPKGPQIPVSEFPSFRGPLLSPVWGTHKFQIPSFRVSEAPSWVRAQGTPNFQIPSFRVSEAPSTDVFSQRDTHIPDSEFPSFEASFCRVHKPVGPPNSRFPVSEFPRTPPLVGSTTNVPDSECNT